jgi:beta-fructofuranosidase
LDAGDAYASNISHDEQSRTILWLWGRTNTPPGRGWNGVMVLPRILSVGPDGFLRQQVPVEFESLRRNGRTFPPRPLGNEPMVLEGVRGDAIELQAEFTADDSSTFGFEVRRSAAGKAAAIVTFQRGMLSVGNVRTYVGNSDRVKVRLFVDKRCFEVYVNDGAVALYTALDAAPEDRGIAVFAREPQFSLQQSTENRRVGNVKLESLQIWEMEPATFSLDHFL